MDKQVKLEEPDYEEVMAEPISPMICDHVEEFRYEDLDIKAETENEPVPTCEPIFAPVMDKRRCEPTDYEVQIIFHLLENGFTMPMFVELMERFAVQKCGRIEPTPKKPKGSSCNQPEAPKKATKRKAVTPAIPAKKVIEPLSETKTVDLPTEPTPPKKYRRRAPVDFPTDLKLCDWSQVEEIRQLIIRRSISRSIVVKGTGVYYKKVLNWLDMISNDLSNLDGQKIINWYFRSDDRALLFDRMHSAGRKYIDQVFIERDYVNNIMTVQESVEISERATELIKEALGDFYFEDAAAKPTLVRDMVRKKRSRALEKQRKAAEQLQKTG